MLHVHIISRKQAKALGMKRYFTGEPCPKGHVCERSMWRECLQCKYEKDRKWKRDNADRNKAYQQAYQERNRQYFVDYNRFSPRADAARKRRVKLTKAGTLNIDDPLFMARNKARMKHLRQLAKQYEEWTGIKFEVDHIVPIIDPNVCGLHWYGNWQLIPMKLNRLKRGVITHELAA
ncbi:hypothetical protein [Salinicola peritrichatus]|uniref:hypothetical protein n=1 Tax=Salinicola peritrichatus TaxID=1267424 RepID=UPI000DA1FD1D|nr:hypothetical protein [Salinicola peritrichatus]